MDRMTQVLEKLINRTQEGKIKWRTTVDPDAFLATLDTSGVIISSIGQPFVETRYRVEIQNQDGVTVIFKEAPSLLAAIVSQEDDQKLAQLLGKLFMQARQSALKVDSTLEELANHLDAIR